MRSSEGKAAVRDKKEKPAGKKSTITATAKKKPTTKTGLTAHRKKPVKDDSGITKKEKKDDTTRNAAYHSGYNTGFTKGYQKGRKETLESISGTPEFMRGYENGFAKGRHAGGNGIVDSLVPDDLVLPDISVEEIIAAGLEHYRPQMIPLLTPQELGERILTALNSRTPMSVVRLGDGELLTLAQDTVMPAAQAAEQGPFLSYAGVDVPDLGARDRLAESVRKATVIGIPKLRAPNLQPLAYAVFRAHHIDYRSLTLTDSMINYHMYQHGVVPRITSGRKVLLIGNKAPGLREVLLRGGVHVSGVIAPVHGVKDVPRIMELVKQHDFDLALVSAGVSAVILAERIASECGKVAVDFGHLADSLANGEAAFR